MERPISARASQELSRRPTRAPNHEAENRVLLGLARDLATSPQRILQRMADAALELCCAHSSGFSLLTEDGNRFHWAAIAGQWAVHVGGGTPREFGPCGMVLDCGEPLLFWHPETRFPYLAEATPCIDEGLLLPFHVGGKAVGTIWVISHDRGCRFDAEDLRIMTSLATFASAAYKAQRDNEHRFRDILDALPAAIYTTDARGRITHYNRTAVEIAGRVPQLGVDEWCVSWKLHRPDGAPLPHEECPMAIALKQGRPVRGAEIVVERPDRTRLYATPYPTPLYDADGILCGAVNMIVDITERKRIEDHLRAIVETTPECVQLVARDGTLLEMNSAGAAMVGARNAQEVVGRSIYGFIAPEHRDAFRAFNERVCDGQRGTLEFDILDLAGTRHHMETHGAPLRSPDGVTVQLALTRDVTERRRAEEALREADRRKDEFIATLSHELRNPLAPLRNALNVLRLQGHAENGTRRIHDVMDRQLNHLVRLVDDLLEISRITTGAIELKRERLDLSSVLRAAVEASAPLIEHAGHHLTTEWPARPVEVEGDGVRLAQVFSNLLNNAARFTERGGRIVLSAAVANGRARVSVRDSGRGFDPSKTDQLFEMFVKGHHSTGLGIGLPLARRLARLHGGDIEASSEGEGRGAEFVVWLPMAARSRDAAAAEPAPQPPASGPRSRRVLVADDNEDSAEMLAALVRMLGAEVCVAFDGEQAVEAARSFRPDVAVLDIGMPVVDGYQAARRLKSELAGTGLRIVALTGWGQEADRRRARDAGFDAHLVKPVDVDALRLLLEADPEP